ncbi:hypothetical protein Tco_1126739 [Tanacetum coccineum]
MESTIACKLLLWSHFKQEKKQQIGSRLEQVYVWFLDSDSIKFLKAIFGIIEELITKIIVYYLFEDEVEFHRINVVVLSVSFNRINEDSIKRLRSTYTWVLQIKVAYVPYWNSNFNKPVDIITECNMEQKPVDIIKESSVEQKEDRKEDNYHVASDIVRGKFVNKYAKREECESLSFDKRLDIGLEIQTVAAITETLSSSLRTVGANEHTICPNIQKGVCLFRRCCDLKHVEGTKDTSNLRILTYGVKAEQAIGLIRGHVPFLSTILSNGSTQKRKMDEIGDSLFPTLGLNGLGGNGRIYEPEVETLGQILQWLIQNPNMMLTNSGGTPTDSRDQTFTYGMKFEIKMSGLNGNSLIVDLETAKMNEDSLGHLKFDIWKWPKRRRKGAKCKVKNRGWKFDFWKWPKRKKSCLTKCKFEHGKWKFDVWRWPNRKKKLTHQFILEGKNLFKEDGVMG